MASRNLFSMTVHRTPHGWACHIIDGDKVFEAETVTDVFRQVLLFIRRAAGVKR